MKLPGSSVYSTALAIFLAAALLLLGAVAFATRSILFSEFNHLESTEAESTMQQLKLMMNRESLRPVDITMGDWSPWTDLYNFANGRNPSFVAENFGPLVLENLACPRK